MKEIPRILGMTKNEKPFLVVEIFMLRGLR
jgi:hypothetical protein